jgi:hypothetical protein
MTGRECPGASGPWRFKKRVERFGKAGSLHPGCSDAPVDSGLGIRFVFLDADLFVALHHRAGTRIARLREPSQALWDILLAARDSARSIDPSFFIIRRIPKRTRRVGVGTRIGGSIRVSGGFRGDWPSSAGRFTAGRGADATLPGQRVIPGSGQDNDRSRRPCERVNPDRSGSPWRRIGECRGGVASQPRAEGRGPAAMATVSTTVTRPEVDM